MLSENARKAKIAVLVSGGGTNLQALIDAERTGLLTSGEIGLVISDREDAYALVRAKNAGIRVEIVERTGRTADEFERGILSLLRSFGADLVVLAGFMRILSAEFLSAFGGRIINVHPSLIPSFCGEGCYGLRVHEAVLARGVKVTGATVHFVNEIPDGGRIIIQKAVEVEETDDAETLQKRVMEEAEHIILPLAAEKVCAEIVRA